MTTSTITVAKALKLKNRLAGRLNKTQDDIRQFNSVLKEQSGKVDVPALLKLRQNLVQSLITLKTKIVSANSPIQEALIQLGELKAELSWLETLPVRDGIERHYHMNTEVLWEAVVKKEEIDQRRRAIEKEIDAIQDRIDTFNHTTKIEIPVAIIELL